MSAGPAARSIGRPVGRRPVLTKGGAQPILAVLAKASSSAWHGGDIAKVYQDTAGTTPAPTAGDLVGRVNDRGLSGVTALQSSGLLKATTQFDGSKPALRYDGIDDFHLVGAPPSGTKGFWIYKFKTAVASVSLALAGVRAGAGFEQLFLNLDTTSHQFGFAIGSVSAAANRAGPDLLNVLATAAIAWDGLNYTEYLAYGTNPAAVVKAAAAMTGIPSTSYAVTYGGLNTAGTVASNQAHDMYQSVQGFGYCPTGAEMLAAMNFVHFSS